MTDSTEGRDPLGLGDLFGNLKRNWGWLLALGVVFVILGAVGLFMVTALTIASVLYFGILCLIGGGFQIIQATKCSGWRAILPHVLIALLYIALGVLIVIDPLLASVSLTMVLAILFIVAGLARLLMAWQMRGAANIAFVAISGLLAVGLGIVILAMLPVSALTVIGLLVAIELIFHGVGYVTLALALKDR